MLTAFDLFSEHGIKNVSMDDIAHNASISKRTLYELFEDKETLLTECINLSYTKMKLSMKQLESEPITALEIALLFYEELMRRPRWFNRKFYDDLKRYPKALQKTEEEKYLLEGWGVNDPIRSILGVAGDILYIKSLNSDHTQFEIRCKFTDPLKGSLDFYYKGAVELFE